jgi:hypothetical protein
VSLILDLDHATGVHQVVGGVEDAALDELGGDPGRGQLVVRTAADDLRGQHADCLLVERAAEGVR